MPYTASHEDIQIESTEIVTWKQTYNSLLNYNNLNINIPHYADYRPTKLQFLLSSSITQQSIKVKIPYANRLARTHVKQAIVCRYNSSTQQWIPIAHVNNKAEQRIEFTTNTVGVYGIFVNHYWYSSFTQRLADEYPNWTEVRKNKGSSGQLFLNYFGTQFETIEDYLLWIQEQKYISTADISTYDWIKMYQLPNVETTDAIEAYEIASTGAKVSVPILESLHQFFYNEQNQGGIIDYKEMKFYTSRAYGDLHFEITRTEQKTTHIVQPMDYHIWNAFDEFGMLLGVQRLHLEKNREYKERILDVFRYPSGTHDIGLTNGIARDLALIQRKSKSGTELVWKNDQKDFVLKNSSMKVIDIRTLRVNDQPLSEEQYQVDEVGNIRIYARKQGATHKISFIYGVDKYQLYERDNEFLHKMMFSADGQASPTLLKWVEYINTVAPVMWDRFNWDEGFWDTIDKQLTGLGYVPNIWDSNIDIWKEYVFESDR